MGKTLKEVQSYYGKVLNSNKDLKTSVCCPTDALPKKHRDIVAMIDDEIKDKFYGCGSPIPEELNGRTILDLGCGTGRDVYLASYLVGERGKVIGVDMTNEQLIVANWHVHSQTEVFGFKKPNVSFKRGYIEDLKSIGIEDDSVDVVISNCVINLSPDKEKVFSEIFRVLKPGGELYFSDVFTGRRVPEDLKEDPVLYGECLAGALYIEDFRRICAKLGYPDYRVITKSRITLENEEIKRKAGMIDFYSMTLRVFKLDTLEDLCEDYGQSATYLGSVEDSPHQFVLDDHHCFITGKPMLVCSNTAAMLEETRFSKHFKINGDLSVHYGPFDCGSHPDNNSNTEGGCC